MTHSTDHRSRLLVACLLGFVSLGVAPGGMTSAAFAQAAPPAASPATGPTRGGTPATAPAPVRVTRGVAISDAVKRLATPPPPGVIASFIGAEVALLAKPDQKLTPSPRATLDRGAGAEGEPAASPPYQVAYAADLNKALLPLFKDPDARVRLSAAIVAAKAAARLTDPTAAVKLAPTATAALADKTEAVVLWGVKGANSIVPRQLDLPARDTKLADAVVRAVQANPRSGAIIEDAYDTFAGPGTVGAGVPAARKTSILPGLINLLNARVGMYQKIDPAVPDPLTGELAFPGSPTADNAALLFFATRAWSKQMPVAQKQRIAQVMLDLAKEMVRLAPTVQPRNATDPPEAVRRDDLIAVLQQTGKATAVIADPARENQPALKAAAGGLITISAGTSDDVLTERLGAMEAALKAAGLLPAQPASDPTTAPAAAP